jgi:hypothetical protein
MKALAARKKVLSAIVVVLILMSLAVPVALAAPPPPPLVLPAVPITANFSDFYLPPAGWPSRLQVTLDGFSGNYSVYTGTPPYVGWCLEDHTKVPSGGPPNGAPLIALYSSYDPPTALKTFADSAAPNYQATVPWDKLNYLLNNKGTATPDDVQAAIWWLFWGDFNPSPDPGVPPATVAAKALADAANTNGANFVPAPGQIIAVILATLNAQGGLEGLGISYPNFVWQDTIIELTVPSYDLGDLPEPTPNYPTLLSSGPSHQLGGSLFLGACVDAETDGQPTNAAATGDDLVASSPKFGNQLCTNDEDGVVRTPNVKWQSGANGGSINVEVAGGPGCLSGWIDWNNNGSLTDTDENIFNNFPVDTRPSTPLPPFMVPVNPANGTFYARFRLYPTDPGGVCASAKAPTGPAVGGEVEDYRWSFGPNAVTLRDLQATPLTNGERLMELLRSWLQQR